MHFCHTHHCHTALEEILIHGQEIIMTTIAQVQADLTQEQDDNAAFRAAVAQFITDAQAAFARLQTSIDNNTLDPAALAALDDALNAGDALTVAATADVTTADAVATGEDVPAPTA